MAIPPGASVWAEQMDPTDRLDYAVQFGDLLRANEKILTASIVLLAEAVALGLTIIQDSTHGPWIADDTALEMWFQIDPLVQNDAAFVPGASLPLELTINTDASPPRRFQRTVVLRVMQL
jgi:hypothetical protein